VFTPDQFLVESQHYRVLLRNNYIWNPGSVVYRRAALESVDGFDLSVPAAADYDLYLRLTRQRPVHCHDTVVAEYRLHGSNMSGDARLMWSTIRRVLQAQAEHVQGDLDAEADLAAGIEGYQLFYGDELLAEIRRQWSRRLPVIERRLAKSVGPRKRKEFIDEIRLLYRWLLQAFSLKRSSIDQPALRRSLATGERRARLEASGLRRAVEGHLLYLDELASTSDPDAGESGAAVLIAGVRTDLEHRMSVAGVRRAVDEAVPEGANVLVVRHGDDELLSLGRRTAWRFPSTDGAGGHPADTEEALVDLDAYRTKGADYLVLPQTELWWLDTCPGLEDGLDARGERIWEDESCRIYQLGAE
jgi:hypothetical protein